MWRLFRWWLVFTGTMFIGTGVVLSAAHLAYRDPFAPYQAFMPGESIDALKDYPCQLRSFKDKNKEFGYCQFEPKYGVFAQILLVASNHTITSVTAFEVHPDAVNLGDLVLCWGQPMSIVLDHPSPQASMSFYWHNQSSARGFPAQYGSSLDYFLPITYLSVEPEWKPLAREAFACTSA